MRLPFAPMHALIVALVSVLTGCGSSSNVLGLLTPSDQRQSFDELLDLAQAAFDRGDLKTALADSQAAFAMEPTSERASLLYGSVNLAAAGGDPFTLANALITQSKGAKAAAAGGGASAVLGELKASLGLGPDTLSLMGHLDTSDESLPVLVPGCAEDVRPKLPQLVALSSAINALCPFVPASAKAPGDSREDCSLHATRAPARAAFLWAFTSLAEALVFDAALTYATVDPSGRKSNPQLRMEKIRSLDTHGDLGPLLAAVQGLEAVVRAVLPADGLCSPDAPTSLLQATLQDLLAADAAFQLIPGVPPHVTAGLHEALAAVEAAAEGARTAALRADFSKSLASDLAAKIDALGGARASPLTPAQKTALCASFGSIAQGTGQASTLCGPAP